MIIVVFLILYVFLLLKGIYVKRLEYTIPLTFKEKEVVKNYFGTKDLVGYFGEYRKKITSNIIFFLPLFLVTLIFNKDLIIPLIPIAFWGYKYPYLKMKKEVYRRKIEFYKEYPNFLNSLKLYLEAGLSLENSLSMYFSDNSPGYYLKMIEGFILKVRIGENRKDILIELISLSRERVIINLLNYFIHFLDLGNKELGYLNYLIDEAWKLKKGTIKKLAEEASAKMIFPMMLIFVGVIILVIVPSISSLGDMVFF